MRDKKKKIFVYFFAALALILIGIFWAYPKFIKPRCSQYKLEKDLAFEVINKDLSPNVIEAYRQKFQEEAQKIKSDSSSAVSWNTIGIIKKTMGDYEGAERAWIRASQINPQASLPFGNLGELYGFEFHKFDRAEEMFLRAIENDPFEPNWYIQLNTIYKDWPEKKHLADKILLQGLEKIGDNPNLVSVLASFYKEEGKTEEAIKYFEKLVILSPQNEMAKEDLAELKSLGR